MPATTPENLYKLKPGAQYIVLAGQAIPIRGLAGDTCGQCFYPQGSAKGYMVHTRQETHREAAERVRAQKSAQCGSDAGDDSDLMARAERWQEDERGYRS